MSLVFMRKRVVAEYVLVICELIINRQTQVVERWQSVTSLSNLHYQIFLAIAESHPKPLSRSDLMTRYGGLSHLSQTRFARTFFKFVRNSKT